MAFQFPDPAVTTEFTGDNGITYSWDAVDGKWVIKRYAADFDDRYVNEEGGDSMEGPLRIEGPRTPNAEGLVSSIQVLNVENTQNSSLHLKHGGTTKVYVGANDLAIASDIKFNRSAGTVIKTDVQDLFNVGEREVAYLGQTTEDEDLVTKKYVDDTVRRTPAYLQTVMTYYTSSSDMSGTAGGFFWASGNLLYRKGASGRILPELKVNDGFRAIKQDGSVLSLEVTRVIGMGPEFFHVEVRTLSTGVSLVNGEQYNVNFMYS